MVKIHCVHASHKYSHIKHKNTVEIQENIQAGSLLATRKVALKIFAKMLGENMLGVNKVRKFVRKLWTEGPGTKSRCKYQHKGKKYW